MAPWVTFTAACADYQWHRHDYLKCWLMAVSDVIARLHRLSDCTAVELRNVEGWPDLLQVLRRTKGSMELVDASTLLPGLQRTPGLHRWRPYDKQKQAFFATHTEARAVRALNTGISSKVEKSADAFTKPHRCDQPSGPRHRDVPGQECCLPLVRWFGIVVCLGRWLTG